MNQRIAPSPRQWFASPVCIRPQPAIDPATGLVEQIWKSKTCARKNHAAKFLRKFDTVNTSCRISAISFLSTVNTVQPCRRARMA